jgi:aromatic-L-amino-acid decarboxylase
MPSHSPATSLLRTSPNTMDSETFRILGHTLVDQLAELLATLPTRPVTPHTPHAEILKLLNALPTPHQGVDAETLLHDTTALLFDHSLFNGHPRFMGYITAAPTPIGILADFLASAVNSNVGGSVLSPLATEIERQAVRWVAEFMGFPTTCGGLFTSGGNVANFTALLAARRAKADWDVRVEGVAGGERVMTMYASKETHTWMQKGGDLFGFGTHAIRWIETDADQRMNVNALREAIEADQAAGYLPFIVIATAGTVSTGVVDPLPEIAALCRAHNLWFHVDGAYGAPAAGLPEASPDLLGIREADSIAFDPHKWLYAPLEAGCVLVRDPQHLLNAFSYRPVYYHFVDDEQVNFYEYGIQNSRGFRALKVWMALRQMGFEGYIQSIREDIALAKYLYERAEAHPELQPFTHYFSITTLPPSATCRLA